MPELHLTNAKLALLVAGLRGLMAKDDLDVLFAMRLSGALELLEPKLKAYQRVREKLDKDYLTVAIKDDDKQTVGYRAPDDRRHEYVEKVQGLDDLAVTLDACPRVKLSELRKMSEEEGIPTSQFVHPLRPIIEIDVEEGASKPAAEEKPKSRAERRKAARDEVKEHAKA